MSAKKRHMSGDAIARLSGLSQLTAGITGAVIRVRMDRIITAAGPLMFVPCNKLHPQTKSTGICAEFELLIANCEIIRKSTSD